MFLGESESFETLTSVEDTIARTIFTETEQNLIKDALIDHVLPFMVEKAQQKSYSDIIGKATSLIESKVIMKSISKEDWIAVENAADLMFKTSEVNKIRIDGLLLLQKLYSNITPSTKPEVNVEKLYERLFGILAKTSRPNPSLLQNIDRLLGVLCKSRFQYNSFNMLSQLHLLFRQSFAGKNGK